MTEKRESAFDLGSKLGVLLSAAQAAMGLCVLRYGTEDPIPMHFNLFGEVDRWGDRGEVAVALFICAAANLIATALLVRAASRAGADRGRRRMIAYGRALALAMGLGLFFLFGALGLGRLGAGDPRSALLATLAGVWVIITLTGAVMGKTRPNMWAGVRLSWTFQSRLAWEKSNRLLGRIYFFGGLAGLVALPFLPPGGVLAMFVAIVFGGAAIAVFEAWRVWKTDPERTA